MVDCNIQVTLSKHLLLAPTLVMLGSLLAGCDESPGELVEIEWTSNTRRIAEWVH